MKIIGITLIILLIILICEIIDLKEKITTAKHNIIDAIRYFRR